MRTHWRIKPYSCPECHRNFVRQDALTRHLRLDFGHNRCSGYPGPVSGSGKDDSPSGSGTESTPVSPVSIKKNPIAIAPAPTSPTSPLDGTSGLTTSPTMDDPSARPSGPRDGLRDNQSSPVEATTSGPSPMSFVHRGASYERAPVSPTNTKEVILGHPPHTRSFSHSGPSGRPLQSPTSSTKPVPLTPTSATFGSHLDPDRDRRSSGAPRLSTIVWSGPPTEAYARQPPGPYEEPRPHAPPQDSPDVRRSPPMGHLSEWSQDRPDPNKARNWDQQYERDARHRNPSWPSTPQGPPPGPGYRPPPARSSTLDSWQRSHSYAYESREEFIGRDPRERDEARSRAQYPVSPVTLTHEKNPEAYTRPPLATLTRDNYQRPEVMGERPEDMDHPQSPSVPWDHRSRSFQGLETVPESRRRYDDYGPLSPVHPRESPRVRDAPPERSNSYGMERSPVWHARGPSSFSTKEFDPRTPRPSHGYEAPPRPSRHDSKIVIRERRLSMSPESSNRSPRAVDGSRFSFMEPQLREGAYPPHRPIAPHEVEGFREERGHVPEEWGGPQHRYPHGQHPGHHEDRYGLPRRERMSVDMSAPPVPKRSLSIATIPQ
ncbi:hypothetical protein BGZ82_001962 [Podila clonocystis]|nr:hypothetical protein BGZ82_001962 [Podila clonocystis]